MVEGTEGGGDGTLQLFGERSMEADVVGGDSMCDGIEHGRNEREGVWGDAKKGVGMSRLQCEGDAKGVTMTVVMCVILFAVINSASYHLPSSTLRPHIKKGSKC